MKFKFILFFTLLAIVHMNVDATVYPNDPRFTLSEEAIKNCVSGRIVYSYQVIEGRPTNMKIISSEPSNYYTEDFKIWWNAYEKVWKNRYIPEYDLKTDGKRYKHALVMEPCSNE